MICVAQRHLPEAGRLAGAADALRSLVGTLPPRAHAAPLSAI